MPAKCLAADWRMGMAYEQLGDCDSARICYQTSLDLGWWTSMWLRCIIFIGWDEHNGR